MPGRIATTLALLNFRKGLAVPEMRADPPGLFVYTYRDYAAYIGEAECLRTRYDEERKAWWNLPELTFNWLILENPAIRQNVVRHLVRQFNPPGNVFHRTGPMPEALQAVYGASAPDMTLLASPEHAARRIAGN